MTTYEEISQCRRANRRFWNAEVRFRIAMIREEAKCGESGHLGRLYHGLGRALQRRQEHQYLENAS